MFFKPRILITDVSATDSSEYFVSVKNEHPELKAVEYVRLLLGYAAQVIYVITPNDVDAISREIIFELISALPKIKTSNWDSAVFSQLPISVQSGVCNEKTAKKITVKLIYLSNINRIVRLKFPSKRYHGQLGFNFVALFKKFEPHMTEFEIDLLRISLANMHNLYSNELDSNLVSSISAVQNQAYLEATLEVDS